jgi:hypothetical protein
MVNSDKGGKAISQTTESYDAPAVTDLGEDLLHMGPSEVGFYSKHITDPTGRLIHLMIWYPTADDVSNKDIAEYPQYLTPPPSTLDNPFPSSSPFPIHSLPAEYY